MRTGKHYIFFLHYIRRSFLLPYKQKKLFTNFLKKITKTKYSRKNGIPRSNSNQRNIKQRIDIGADGFKNSNDLTDVKYDANP